MYGGPSLPNKNKNKQKKKIKQKKKKIMFLFKKTNKKQDGVQKEI